jgi:hypothetical protein
MLPQEIVHAEDAVDSIALTLSGGVFCFVEFEFEFVQVNFAEIAGVRCGEMKIEFTKELSLLWSDGF